MYKVLIIQYPTFLLYWSGGVIRIPRRPDSLRSRESQPFFLVMWKSFYIFVKKK